jgi:hypothetical protein
MRLSRILGVPLFLSCLALLASCAGINYRDQAAASQTRYAAIENFGDEEITAEQVDGLLEEVAAILRVPLDPARPKVRIIVASPSRITEMYRRLVTVAPHGADAMAFYLPGASLVMISSYDRLILGHELAHYITDHYLKTTPRRDWEKVAYMVQDMLPLTAAIARRPVPESVVTAQATALTAH